VERFFQEVGLEPGARPLVLNITRWAYRPDRWWPVERYRRLVQFLAGRSQPLLVTHAPADQGWVRELLAGLQPLPGVFCSPSLKEFAGLLASARAVITAEGGPMHLAAAVATPLVVLWGLTPQEMWRPWGVAHRIVGGAGPVELIEVEEVVAALDDLLQETPPTPAGGE
jgi:heptosyltransferase-3